MLVLSRDVGEAVVITIPGRSNPIRITCVDVRCNSKTRLGFDADSDIVIHREEIAQLVEQEKAQNSEKTVGDGQVAG